MHQGKFEMNNETSPATPTPASGGSVLGLSMNIIQAIMKVTIDSLVFLVIALAPAIPYLKQYIIIKAQRSVGAFSIYVCAIILYGQAFRILFWYVSALMFEV